MPKSYSRRIGASAEDQAIAAMGRRANDQAAHIAMQLRQPDWEVHRRRCRRCSRVPDYVVNACARAREGE